MALLAVAACAPKAPPLVGIPAPAYLPRIELPSTPRRITFNWEASDADLIVRGEGLARMTRPDSARVDLFLAGGFGSGTAWLLGDTILVPGVPMVRRYLPPPPMLWAAFGRLAVPGAADTVVRVDGDTLRADIGRDPRWRITIAKEQLVRLEYIVGERRRSWVVRAPSGRIHYRDEDARRTLTITPTAVEETGPLDATIWPR